MVRNARVRRSVLTEHQTLRKDVYVNRATTAGADAVEALLSASRFVGLDAAVPAAPDRGIDLVVAVPGGSTLAIAVKASSVITADSAPRQLERWSRPGDGGVVPVAVADRITADARAFLADARWSWLDLRGHLRLTAPGVFIDTEVPAMSDPGVGSCRIHRSSQR